MKAVRRSMLLCVAAFALFSGAAAQATVLDDVMKTKTIRIAIPTDYPPYGFVGTDMQPQGMDIDVARLVAVKMGVKVELVPVTSANRLPYLQTRKADVVISTLGKNDEREKVIDFTSAYAPFFQAVFASRDLPIKSFADLVGKSVAVTRGAMEDQELAKVTPPGVDVKRFEDNAGTIAAFVSGQTQVVAVSASGAANMISRNPHLNAEYKLLLKESPCFAGVAKGEDALRLRINQVIADATASGELETMSQKWLGRPLGVLPR